MVLISLLEPPALSEDGTVSLAKPQSFAYAETGGYEWGSPVYINHIDQGKEGLTSDTVVKNLPANAGDAGDIG